MCYIIYYRTQSRLRAEDRPFGRHEDEEFGCDELLQRLLVPEPPAGAERGSLPLRVVFARHVGKEDVADVCREVLEVHRVDCLRVGQL